MLVIAIGVARAVLHVANEGIVPVDEIERSVGCEFHVDGSKVGIGSVNEILSEGAFESRAIVAESVLFGAEKSDGVIDENIALDLVGEVAAGDDFESGSGADFYFQEVGWIGREVAIAYADGTGEHPAHIGVGGVGEEVLSPFIEGDAPGIWNGKSNAAFEVSAGGIVAKEASVRAADGAVGRFDITVKEGAFAHVDRAGWVGAESGNGVVGVVVVEAAEDDFGFVGAVIAVGVAEVDQGIAL